MATPKKRDGVPLMVDGNPTTCCCAACCDLPAVVLLSISDLVLDEGETCDPACLPELNEIEGDGNWFHDPGGAGTSIFAHVECITETGEWKFSTEGINVYDAGFNLICIIATDFEGTILDGFSCDPVFWEGDIPVTVFDPFFVECGTGMLHLIISE